MLVVNPGLSGREKLLIFALILILAFAGYVWYDMSAVNDPNAKYQRDSVYCEKDYDCYTVYDISVERCLTVNGFHRERYEYDNSCRGKQGVCVSNKCFLK